MDDKYFKQSSLMSDKQEMVLYGVIIPIKVLAYIYINWKNIVPLNCLLF